MKRHAIIPIFIPHRGCPNDCVFCNQRKITASSGPVSPEEVREKIELWLTTLSGRPGMETVEIAFYGGSFTGIPLEEQIQFLTIAKEYKDRGLVQKIHLSTRPDYISREILDHLKGMSVDVIELGVQSFDEGVLRASKRGHDAGVVEESARLIRDYGFTLGIQLMIGLPKDSYESCIASARKTVELKPDIARLYPTVIIRDTELYEMWKQGTHIPPNQEEIVRRTAHMYKILTEAEINVIRVGLKSSDLINDAVDAAGGTYHPAVRQLVCGYLAKESLEEQLQKLLAATNRPEGGCRRISFYANGASMSDLIGWQGENKKYFKETYPQLSLRFEKDDSLAQGQYVCREKEEYMVHLGNDWDQVLAGEFEKDYYLELRKFLKEEYSTRTIYPSMYDIFNALKHTAYKDVKVVILGQDPYHGPGQAHGMCFSVQKGVKVPPSLVNIYKELKEDVGFEIPNHGFLQSWADQGVLLMNTVLTVRGGLANSHKGKGWERFTDQVIRHLNDREQPMVFLLWGANAKSKMQLITNPRHLILTAAHPSPLSAYNGFYGCRHFSRTNLFLKEQGMKEIDWQIPLE